MTLKQMKAIKGVMEEGLSVSKAMLKAGYSPNHAKNPQELTKSQAWREVVENYLPDHRLFKTHEEALKATKWNDFTGEREEDHATRLKAVDMAYKLKGRTMENHGNIGQQVNIMLDSSGYIPPNNILNIKPTKRK